MLGIIRDGFHPRDLGVLKGLYARARMSYEQPHIFAAQGLGPRTKGYFWRANLGVWEGLPECPERLVDHPLRYTVTTQRKTRALLDNTVGFSMVPEQRDATILGEDFDDWGNIQRTERVLKEHGYSVEIRGTPEFLERAREAAEFAQRPGRDDHLN